MAESSTMQALKAVQSGGMTVAEAARAFQISTAAVYAAMRRREGKKICPCCGQVVRPGFTLSVPEKAKD